MTDLPASRAVVTCSRCGEGLVADDRFCGGCGARVNSCRGCGNVLVAGNRNCPQCGQAVNPSKITAQLSKPGIVVVPDAEWTEILAKVQAATIGDLHFIKQLGRGGMAAVYLAEDIQLSRMVAVKLILPELMSDERMVQRFQEEAKHLAKLRHPNIVRVFAVREAAGIHFFTMDYIEGRSLESILDRNGALGIPVVRSVLAQVASALGNAHRQGVFHRDVKPANILIDTDGNAYITDFGIAKASNNTSKSKTLTQFGAVVGTPAYISPEQCLSRPVTGASDQYSLGVVAYEMIAGHPPFDDQNSFALMRCHTDEPVPPLREQRPTCPPEIEAAVLRMLSKKPGDRFGSMLEAVTALGAHALPEGDPLRLAFASLAVPEPLPPESVINTPPVANIPAPPSKEPPRAAMIGIASAPEAVDVGDRFTMAASARDATGAPLPGTRVTFSSSDPNVASIDARTGEVVALMPGHVEFSAAADRARSTIQLTVALPAPSTIKIGAPTSPLHPGDEVQLSAGVSDKSGAGMSGRQVEWSSSSPNIASVSNDGVLTARAVGKVEITARCESAVDHFRVEISARPVASIELSLPDHEITAGDAFQISSRALDALGEVVRGRPIVFFLSGAAASVVGDRVETTGAGTLQVTAECDGIRREATIVVVRPGPARLELSAPPPTVHEGDEFDLTVTVHDARGEALTGISVRWLSLTPDIASVTGTGGVQAIRSGTARINCSVEKLSASAEFLVEQPAVAVLQLSAAPSELTVGQSFRVVATPADVHGTHLVGRMVTWSSDHTSIARVSASGVITTAAHGTATITGTCEGISSDVLLVVAPPPAASVSISNVPASIDVGKRVRAEATVLDVRGARLQSTVSWTSTRPSIATVSSDGEVTAVSAGTTRIMAAAEGIESCLDLVVAPKPIVITARTTTGASAPVVARDAGTQEALPVKRVSQTFLDLPALDVTPLSIPVTPSSAEVAAPPPLTLTAEVLVPPVERKSRQAAATAPALMEEKRHHRMAPIPTERSSPLMVIVPILLVLGGIVGVVLYTRSKSGTGSADSSPTAAAPAQPAVETPTAKQQPMTASAKPAHASDPKGGRKLTAGQDSPKRVTVGSTFPFQLMVQAGRPGATRLERVVCSLDHSSNPGIATVEKQFDMVTAVAPGRVTIFANCQQQIVKKTFIVEPR